MIINGWLLLEIELTPRIVIEVDAPGTPELLVTSTPATRPWSALMKFWRCVCAMSMPCTVCCAVPMARRTFVWPNVVTTTASRLVAARLSWTSMTLPPGDAGQRRTLVIRHLAVHHAFLGYRG